MAIITKNKGVKITPPKNIGFNRRMKNFMRKLSWLIQITLILVIGYLIYFPTSSLNQILTNRLIALSLYPNFTLQNVYLEGQHYTKRETILKAINLKIGQPILSISLNELQTKIERVAWVKHAIISRVLPNSIYISIKERTPIAIWQSRGKFYLIEEDGGIINEVSPELLGKLIIITGDDGPLNTAGLIKIISKDPALYNQVASSIRVGERRWNVRFKNGLEIKLPEGDFSKAWDYVIKLNDNNLLFTGAKSIDLRVDNKIFVKRE